MKAGTKAKLERFKVKFKQHLPEIMIVGSATFGAIGWVLAGVYRQKLEEYIDSTVEFDPAKDLEVGSRLLQDVREGETLRFWISKVSDGSKIAFMITDDDKSREMVEAEFEEHNEWLKSNKPN